MRPPAVVFLDRDGVINRFPGIGRYVVREKDLKLMPRSLRAIRLLTDKGYEMNIISNQGCVSRGLITKSRLMRMTRNLLKKVRAAGGKIKSVHYCFHRTSDGCDCKKPKITLLKRALGGRRFGRKQKFFVGDSAEDMLCGNAAGCTTVAVLSGRLKRADLRGLPVKPDRVVRDLLEAAEWITQKKS